MDRESNARVKKDEIKATNRYIKIPDCIYNTYIARKKAGTAGSIHTQLFNDLVNNGGYDGEIY